jgi:hypothetical protein
MKIAQIEDLHAEGGIRRRIMECHADRATLGGRPLHASAGDPGRRVRAAGAPGL